MPPWEIMIIIQWRLEWPGRYEGLGATGRSSPRSSVQGQVKVACRDSPPHLPLPPRSLTLSITRTLAAAVYTAKPLFLLATGNKALVDGRVDLTTARSVVELVRASGGKRLSQHNSVVCPLRVNSAMNLVLYNFVPLEGKT